jgi:hypothetical protein
MLPGKGFRADAAVERDDQISLLGSLRGSGRGEQSQGGKGEPGEKAPTLEL